MSRNVVNISFFSFFALLLSVSLLPYIGKNLEVQTKLQWNLIIPEVGQLIRQHVDLEPISGVFISTAGLSGFLPGMAELRWFCPSREIACAESKLDDHQKAYILTGGGPFKFTENSWLIDDKFLLGTAKHYRLYGPFFNFPGPPRRKNFDRIANN